MTLCTRTTCKFSGRKCYYEVDPVCPLGVVDFLRVMIRLRLKTRSTGI